MKYIYFKELIEEIVVIFTIIVIGVLLHTQIDYKEKNYKNEIYDLKAEVESLRETIDIYEKNGGLNE